MMHLFLLALTLLVAACAPFKPSGTTEQAIIVPTTVYDQIPQHLLDDCTFPVLPDADEYDAASTDERERLLMRYIVDIRSSLSICSMQIRTIREWDKGRGS